MLKVGFVYFNEFFHDSRGEKEARSLIAQGFCLSIFAYQAKKDNRELDAQKPDLLKYISRYPIFGFKKIPLIGRVAALFFYNLWLFKKCRALNRVHIHSPMLLPMAWAVKTFRKRSVSDLRLIYDCHEIEWAKSGISRRDLFATKVFERVFISKMDCVLTVSEKIAQMYKLRYQIDNVSVLQNYPISYRPERPGAMRQRFSIENEAIVFVYVGRLTKGRGIEEWVRAVINSEYNIELVLIGYGPLESQCKRWAEDESSLHFSSAMPQKDLIEFIQDGDFGVNTPPLLSESRKNALPNKLFEYLSAGLEVIVNKDSSRAEFVERYNCGYVIEDHQVESILSIFDVFEKHRPIIKRQLCYGIAEKHTWESIQSQLVEIYK